jgi:hypothetical protein
VPELFSFLADFFPKFTNLRVLLFSKVGTSKALLAATTKDYLESGGDASWHYPCSNDKTSFCVRASEELDGTATLHPLVS